MFDLPVYKNNNGSPEFNDARRLNHRVYFRFDSSPYGQFTLPGTHAARSFTLIAIPGNSRKLDQHNIEELTIMNANNHLAPDTPPQAYPRNGSEIDPLDYDQEFWVETDSISTEKTKNEYLRYANGVIFGSLTAPFKYRLKSGSVKESVFEGDINIGAYSGWKWRISSTEPYFVSIIGFAELTSLTYTSSDNTAITDSKQKENGTGLTYGFGGILRFGTVSPGFILGWDHGTGDLGSTFIYTDHPWISFSLNYEFLKPKKDEKSNTND